MTRIDPATNTVVMTTPSIGINGNGIAADEGSVWVSLGQSNKVVSIDPATNEVAGSVAATDPLGVVLGDGSVWVSLPINNVVVRIEPTT